MKNAWALALFTWCFAVPLENRLSFTHIYLKKDEGMENEKEESRLTVEELRKYKGLENLTEGEAEEAITTIEKLAYLLVNHAKKELEKKKKQ